MWNITSAVAMTAAQAAFEEVTTEVVTSGGFSVATRTAFMVVGTGSFVLLAGAVTAVASTAAGVAVNYALGSND